MATQQNPLNSLRNLINPADDVDFELNLNRHPKNHKNKSLVDALNVKISDDGTVLENDNSILINHVIYDKLNAKYGISNYEIIHVIPTNTELVLFVKYKNVNTFDIWRYREKTDTYNEEFALFYDKGIPYHKGKFSSTFTYNSFDCLIIAYCEYDGTEDCPLSTINLGNFTSGDLNGFIWNSDAEGFDDRDLDTYKLPMCPEVSLPNINSVTTGNNDLYVGWYYPYIRYKINKYDYTQWYSFGIPLINNMLNDAILYKRDGSNLPAHCDDTATALDGDSKYTKDSHELVNAPQTSRRYNYIGRFSSMLDLIQHSINIKLTQLDNRYTEYQLGFRCVSKTYNKYFRTEDININNTNFEICLYNLIEENINIINYSNYYNVKNLINKRNKLYIANYKEHSYKYKTDIQQMVDNIDVKLIDGDVISLDFLNTFKDWFPDLSVSYDQFNLSDILKYGVKFTLAYTGGESNKPVPIGVYDPRTKIALNTKSLILFIKFICDKTQDNTILSHLSNTVKFKVKNAVPVWDENNPIRQVSTIEIIDKDKNNNPFNLLNLTIGYNNTLKLVDRSFGTWMDYEHTGTDPVNYGGLDNLPSVDYYYIKIDEDQYIAPNVSLQFFARNDNDNPLDYDHYEELDQYTIIFEDGYELDLSKYIQYGEEFQQITSASQYIEQLGLLKNPTNSYNLNYIDSLIPGEIYDFYIHFINKYNESTDGYRLTNHAPTIYCNTDGENYAVTSIFVSSLQKYITVGIPSKYKILTKNDNNEVVLNLPIYWQDENIFEVSDLYYNQQNNRYEFSPTYDTLSRMYADAFKKTFKGLIELNNFDITWGDLLDSSAGLNIFLHYVNSEGHDLFKVPYINKGHENTAKAIQINNVILPEGYIGYFISAAKHEKTIKISGLGGTRNAARILFNDIININKVEYGANILRCTDYDNKIREWNNFRQNTRKIYKYQDSQAILSYLMVGTSSTVFAVDGQSKRGNKGSAMIFNGALTAYINDPTWEELVVCDLIYINPNIYSSPNKQLYRIGDVQYNNTINILHGFNGRFTRNSITILGTNNEGVEKLYCADNGEHADHSTHLYGDVAYSELYEFNLGDSETLYITKSAEFYNKSTDRYIYKEVWYEPVNTLDLFDKKLNNQFDGILELYSPISNNKDYLTQFNRTVYRSNVISDESKQNNWRFFEPDAYKNIEENKGNITNLLSIGTFLYVHTEHSLFAFSDDNSLEMNNQQLQVSSPDIFDTEYKEQFNTILGYGGLQQLDNWIAGSFGYIYYNKDDKQVININNKSIGLLSNDTYEYIQSFNPEYILFANDVENNRVILKLYNKEDDKTEYLSYNYKHKKFVSFHSMGFDKAYNTKDRLYLLDNNVIKSFDNTNIYGYNEGTYSKGITTITKDSDISFIINRQYYEIKYLENITYKLRQRTDKDYNHKHYPVEMDLVPYSGHNLEVFNDMINTGYLNILVNDSTKNQVKDFDKPYYELGNWHLNYLRDIHNEGNNPNSDTMSRLYGNYFIIHFNFKVNKHIEFENLDVQLTQDNNR